ncbi:MAG TPA: hypothetical protein VJL30_02660 [Patescibacteria group bacterium]|nr:hypothetical protein [Patescibacteria group bacterium]
MEKNKSIIMGIWKFQERVGEKDLIDLANEWAKDEKYLQLYIRKVSKDQLGIGFAYLGDGTKEVHDDYFNKTSDQLKRKFGNDLAGWDIASTSTLIKGF